MKKLLFLVMFCFTCFGAFATRYFPSSATAPFSGTAQAVCVSTGNAATTVTYAVCGTTSGNAASSLSVIPTWYFNNVLVYTGTAFNGVAGGGTITLPASAFTYPATGGTYTGINGLKVVLTWTNATPAGCVAGMTVTGSSTDVTIKNAPVAISGNSSLCAGAAIGLGDITPNGTWTSSSVPVASVGVNNGLVIGGAGGSVTITYSTGCGTSATKALTVIPDPVTITGPNSICINGSITVSDAAAGGTWSSSNTGIASVVAGTGVMHAGSTPGTTTITYSTGCGTNATEVITVIGSPAAISAPTTLCAGISTLLSDPTTGGTWSAVSSSVATINTTTGQLYGVAVGTANITYSIGCGTAATATVNIVSATVPPITGPSTACLAGSALLSDAMAGGVWSSANPAVATVDATGTVYGVTLGTANISYSVSFACGTPATKLITTQDVPSPATIAGNFLTPFCAGTVLSLTDPSPNGVWRTDDTNVAKVDSFGAVTGVGAGQTFVYYAITNNCGTVSTGEILTVDTVTIVPAITGNHSVCIGSQTTLGNTLTGGTWSSGATAVLSINSTGVITGVGTGAAIVSYSVSNSCGISAATATIAVNTTVPPSTISGLHSVCPAHHTGLAESTSGGVWHNDHPAFDTVSASGIVYGIAPGMDTIRYTVTNSCSSYTAKYPMTILQLTDCNTAGTAVTEEQTRQLKVFPNPNGGSFSINMVSDVNEPVHVVITNMVGSKMREFDAATNKAVDVNLDPTPGVYFISVATASENMYLRS